MRYWSLGVVLYEMLTGSPPHTETNVLQLCASILESAPASPLALRPEVPIHVDAAVRKCLARDRDDRFATVSELARCISTDSDPNALRPVRNWILRTHLPCDGANQTEPDAALPNRREIHVSPALWLVVIFAALVGVSLLLVISRRQFAHEALASHAAVAAPIVNQTQWPAVTVLIARCNDPVGGGKAFADLPAPTLLLITHFHGDHFRQGRGEARSQACCQASSQES